MIYNLSDAKNVTKYNKENNQFIVNPLNDTYLDKVEVTITLFDKNEFVRMKSSYKFYISLSLEK